MNNKAIALISGGLDSLLAAKIVQDQGVEVQGIAFVMAAAVTDVEKTREEINEIADKCGIPVKIIDISEDFLRVIESPKNGYGANMNPCIDCKILMISKAREIMEQEGAEFIISGEVLGERPMSQNRRAMEIIERSSCVGGLLLRPLSARLLEKTVPEENAMVDRTKLLAISGRSRKPQLELARKYGIKRFSAPGVSCLLTDPLFSRKIKDLIYNGKLDSRNVDLLKYGRHFRISSDTKVIVGRNEEENRRLRGLRVPGEKILRMEKSAGPDVLLMGDVSPVHLSIAGALAVSHSRRKNQPENTVAVWEGLKKERVITVKPLPETEIGLLRI